MNALAHPADELLPASRWVNFARWSTIVAVCTVVIWPAASNAATFLLLVALLASGQAWPRQSRVTVGALTFRPPWI